VSTFNGRPSTIHIDRAIMSFRPALIVVDFQEDFCPPVRAAALASFPG
jgi:hypothetical protein